MRGIYLWVIGWLVVPALLWTLVHLRAQRPARTEQVSIPRPPSSHEDAYRHEWAEIKARFEAVPGVAIAQADELLGRILDGGDQVSTDPDARAATMALGVELGRADRKDLKRLFRHYESVLDEALAPSGAAELTIERDPLTTIDLRAIELELRRHG